MHCGMEESIHVNGCFYVSRWILSMAMCPLYNMYYYRVILCFSRALITFKACKYFISYSEWKLLEMYEQTVHTYTHTHTYANTVTQFPPIVKVQVPTVYSFIVALQIIRQFSISLMPLYVL